MRISSRFTIAVHILSLLATCKGQHMTSEYIAGSVNTNPVIIRQLIGLLKKAGLTNVRRGAGGAYLLKEPGDITLFDVYLAVEAIGEGALFNSHEHPNPACPVGANIHRVLLVILRRAQHAMEDILKGVTIQELSELMMEKDASE